MKKGIIAAIVISIITVLNAGTALAAVDKTDINSLYGNEATAVSEERDILNSNIFEETEIKACLKKNPSIGSLCPYCGQRHDRSLYGVELYKNIFVKE